MYMFLTPVFNRTYWSTRPTHTAGSDHYIHMCCPYVNSFQIQAK